MAGTKIRYRVGDLVNLLLEQFLSKPQKPDSPFLSTRNISLRYKVSPLTADRAVQELVRQGYLYRKNRSGTYVAPLSSPASTKTIALITASNIFKPIQQLGNEKIIQHCNDNSITLKNIDFQTLQDRQKTMQLLSDVDGILVSGETLDDNTQGILQQVSCPIVLLRYDYNYSSRYHQVLLDFTQAFQQIAQGIHESQNVWLLSENHRNGDYRRDEMLKALHARGIPEANIHQLQVDFKDAAVPNYRQFLKLAPQLQNAFIFSTSDVESDILLNALTDQGMKPIRDFQLVSCDNWGKYDYGTPGLPGLTSVDCFSVEIAEESVKLLLRLMEEPSACQFIVKRHAELVCRDTTRQTCPHVRVSDRTTTSPIVGLTIHP